VLFYGSVGFEDYRDIIDKYEVNLTNIKHIIK
jgi:hypothetical protein